MGSWYNKSLVFAFATSVLLSPLIKSGASINAVNIQTLIHFTMCFIIGVTLFYKNDKKP